MQEKKVWEVVDYPGRRDITEIAPFSWVYSVKRNTEGVVPKFKARLVIILGNKVPSEEEVFAAPGQESLHRRISEPSG
eukprot:346168-Hanusia_phi.AAC.3